WHSSCSAQYVFLSVVRLHRFQILRRIALLMVMMSGATVSGSAQERADASPSSKTSEPARLSQAVKTPEPERSSSSGHLLSEPPGLSRGIELAANKIAEDVREPRDGAYPELGKMITGAGWISIGSGYRRHLTRRLRLETSAAL